MTRGSSAAKSRASSPRALAAVLPTRSRLASSSSASRKRFPLQSTRLSAMPGKRASTGASREPHPRPCAAAQVNLLDSRHDITAGRLTGARAPGEAGPKSEQGEREEGAREVPREGFSTPQKTSGFIGDSPPPAPSRISDSTEIHAAWLAARNSASHECSAPPGTQVYLQSRPANCCIEHCDPFYAADTPAARLGIRGSPEATPSRASRAVVDLRVDLFPFIGVGTACPKGTVPDDRGRYRGVRWFSGLRRDGQDGLWWVRHDGV